MTEDGTQAGEEELEEDDENPDFEDVDDEDGACGNDRLGLGETALNEAQEEFHDHQMLEKVFKRRILAIPSLSQLLKTKKPAETLPFLIVSNLASFLFYSRYYNGNLLDVDPLRITASLTTQLLGKESQNTVNTEFQSSYFDHLKALVTIGHLSAETISDFQPVILHDLKVFLSPTSGPIATQLVTEAFLRYYDLLSFSEQLCLDKKQRRGLKRNIVASKQKLIFYLSFLTSKKV